MVRRDESPDGGGKVSSIALNSLVSANNSKLQAMVSRQNSRIFKTPYLEMNKYSIEIQIQYYRSKYISNNSISQIMKTKINYHEERKKEKRNITYVIHHNRLQYSSVRSRINQRTKT